MIIKNNIGKTIIFLLMTVLLINSFPLSLNAEYNSYDYLKFNQVMDEEGNWVYSEGYYNPNWENYNCYAFAINRIEDPQFYESGNYFRYSPGNICGTGNCSDADSVQELAEFVRDDLFALGYTNVQILDVIPETLANGKSISESEELICVRRASNGDYHFMQYDYDSNAWYHKPGNTAVLKYIAHNGVPGNNASWISEYYYSGIVNSNNITYDSNIIFIKYSNLELEAQWGYEITENITVKSKKDTIYEITVDRSDYYDIKMSAQDGEFTYEIYAYNKFNGNYEIIKNGTSNNSITESVYINVINMYYNNIPGWELQAYKYYIRLHYNKNNISDKIVSVSIEHSHNYNDHYEQPSPLQHKAYCKCGECITQNHGYFYTDVADTYHTAVCICGFIKETEEHYNHHYARNDQLTHYVYCECGRCIRTSYHVVPAGNNFFKICIHCGERINMGEVLLPTPGPGIQSVCQITYITNDGSYVDRDGIIYLVESDMALYLAGELDVYALAQDALGVVTQ